MLLGHIDLVDRHVVRGWAADTDRPYGTIEVAVFVNGRLMGLARADEARDDLKESAVLGAGLHGITYRFEPELPALQEHEIVVRFAEGGKLLGQRRVAPEPETVAPEEPAEDAGPSDDGHGVAPLGNGAAPVSHSVSGAMPGQVLISFIDSLTREGVHGWAASETNPDEVFDLSIFVDEHKVAQLTADAPRRDLAKTGRYGDGARGFAYQFDPPLPPGRDVRVRVTFARTGLPLTKGDVRLIGDRMEPVEPPAALPEDEPRLLHPPSDPAGLFAFLGLHSGEEELSRLLARLEFSDASPEQMHYSVFGRYPATVDDALRWGTYYARDHLHELLLSDAFQTELIPLFLRAFPNHRRLIFVHIPKCAGTDLSFHFRARFPSLGRSLTEPAWTTKPAMLRRIARVVAHAQTSDSIFVHGHINLADYIAADLIRPFDQVFTVIREPFAMAISQINYVLTRFGEDIARGTPGPDTTEWSALLNLGPLPRRMSDEFVARVARATLHCDDLVKPNALGSWLGGEGAQMVVDRLAMYNVEVTDTARYNTWLREAWGITAHTRWNESKKFITPDDISVEDLAHLNRITSDDRRLYRTIERVLDATGKPAISGDDLRGVVVA